MNLETLVPSIPVGIAAVGIAAGVVEAAPSSAGSNTAPTEAVYSAATVKNLGAEREVLWDMERIAELGGGAALRLHHPELREVAIVHDAPWEGNVCCYHTIMRDGALYRMYYRGASSDMPDRPKHQVVCYAESDDGIVWRKPNLGLCEYDGSKENNIILLDDETQVAHNFTPFVDGNPKCPPDERYKAVAGEAAKKGLFGYVSADGLHWRRTSDVPMLDKRHGHFDSQNLCFWDAARGAYALYFRKFDGNRRKIRFATSPDFRNWSGFQWLEYDESSPDVELYTNSTMPYDRAKGVYVGFPMRFCAGRHVAWDPTGAKALPGVTDGVFMCGRGGLRFRLWGEAFLRPGLQNERWLTRNNMTAWGMVRTRAAIPGCPDEYSLYSTENYYSKTPNRLRRMTIRLDGFVSVNAPWSGGSVTTKPLTFAVAEAGATRLLVNASTSGSGFVRCEVRDIGGVPIPGFSLSESEEAYGDDIELEMRWKGGNDLSSLAGKPVILHFELKDADIFSYHFGK